MTDDLAQSAWQSDLNLARTIRVISNIRGWIVTIGEDTITVKTPWAEHVCRSSDDLERAIRDKTVFASDIPEECFSGSIENPTLQRFLQNARCRIEADGFDPESTMINLTPECFEKLKQTKESRAFEITRGDPEKPDVFQGAESLESQQVPFYKWPKENQDSYFKWQKDMREWTNLVDNKHILWWECDTGHCCKPNRIVIERMW